MIDDEHQILKVPEIPTPPVYVTAIADRTPSYAVGITMPLDVFGPKDQGLNEWWSQFSSRSEFTFPSFKSEGVRYYYQLQEAIRARNEAVIPGLLAKIEQYMIPAYHEK